MKPSPSVVIAAAFVLFASVGPASAKAKEREITLEFVPQEATGASAPLPFDGTPRAVKLVFEDGRPEAERDRVGDGTEDDESTYPWRPTNSVREYAEGVFRSTASVWGVRFDESADLELLVRVVRFYVTERDQAVGSTYKADVRVAFEVGDGDAHLVSGSASGEARRYGRARRADNANEVLSDAMKEAYASVFDAPRLRKVLMGRSPALAPEPEPEPDLDAHGDGMSPAKLLTEVLRLHDQAFSPELVIRYIDQQTLTAPFTADDLVEWKRSGLPESVIEAAFARYPRTKEQ